MFGLLWDLTNHVGNALGCLFVGVVIFAFFSWDWNDGWGWWTTSFIVLFGGWEYLKHKLGITGGDGGSGCGQSPEEKE